MRPRCSRFGTVGRAPVPLERGEQVTLAQWLDLHRVRWFHVPNGGHRDVRVAARLKAEGVKPGVPDVVIVDRPPHAPMRVGTVIELKRESGGDVSKEQRRWLDAFRERGWSVHVAHGAKEAIQILEGLGYGR